MWPFPYIHCCCYDNTDKSNVPFLLIKSEQKSEPPILNKRTHQSVVGPSWERMKHLSRHFFSLSNSVFIPSLFLEYLCYAPRFTIRLDKHSQGGSLTLKCLVESFRVWVKEWSKERQNKNHKMWHLCEP